MVSRAYVPKVEEWRPVIGFENYYEVSNYGRVRSLDRFKNNHSRQQICKGRILKIHDDSHGYYQVVLSKFGKNSTHKVHRLVATAFIPNECNKGDVNHKNGNRKDNRVENLEWCTRSENLLHMYRVLNNNPRKKSPVVCLETGVEFESCMDAQRKTGIPNSNINAAARHKVTKHPDGHTYTILTAGGFHWRFI